MPDDIAWNGYIPTDEPPPHETIPDAAPDIAPDTAPVKENIIPLGHDRGVFYYLSLSAKQVFALQAGQHSKNTLMAMASVPYYWQRTSFCNEKGKIDWEAATDHLMRSCRDVGIYDSSRIRGRGVWLDQEMPVFHVGGRLIVDGQPCDLTLPGSRYVYEAAQPMSLIDAAPLSNSDANKLVEIARLLSWDRGINATLLAGFIAVAPICGGLNWRPSIWLTGASKSGKTFVYENILRPALAGTGVLVEGATTEPGIRRLLRADARPVLFDEAEQEGTAAFARMQAVLALVRSSSSENGAVIAKGARPGEREGEIYRVRSSFAFVSINVGIEHHADESRITVMGLRGIDRSTPEAKKKAEADFAVLKKSVASTITPGFCAGLLARSVKLLPVIRKNIETFAEAISLHLGDRRLGDQLGTLLAGAFSLHSDREISPDQAAAYVQRQDWEIVSDDTATETDEARLLAHLTQSRVRISPGNGVNIDCTIGRLISAVAGRDPLILNETADLELRQIGIKVVRTPRVGAMISTSHPALRRMLVDTPWTAGWSRVLSRIEGAVANQLARFTPTFKSRATFIPMPDAERMQEDET